jgi:4-amino-4-deoxy-L-arabinose transferase-like glycosyltransferase
VRAWLLAVLVALLWFGNLEHRKLVDPDEGRYAEIPREMVATGDWITPRLNGLKYFEKPALQYWATAIAYEVFGQHHWTARLWSALTGLLGIFVVWETGRRLFGADAGLYAALVLGGSLGYVVVAQFNNLDMGVSFFMGLALCAFLLAQDERGDAHSRLGWMLLAWAATAGAVLSKGLIGLVLPGLVIAAYVVAQRDWRLLTRLHLGWGLVVLLALTAPWFVVVSLRNPEFFDFFFIHEHFVRFLTREHQRYQPWWWFVPVLLVGIFPWVMSAGAALFQAWGTEGESRAGFKPRRFLLLWAVVIFGFFSASSSKLAAYILPMFPALALLAGDRLARATPRALASEMQPALLLWLVLLGAALYLAAGPGLPGKPLVRNYAMWVAAAAALGLAGALVAVHLARRGNARKALLSFAAGGLVAGQLLIGGFDVLSPERSGYWLAQAMKPYARPEVPIYSVATYEQSIPFYLQRTLTLVAYRGELELGLDQEPHKWVPDLGRFTDLWSKAPEALAVMPRLVYEHFSKEGLPMEKIAEDSDRVAVRKP